MNFLTAGDNFVLVLRRHFILKSNYVTSKSNFPIETFWFLGLRVILFVRNSLNIKHDILIYGGDLLLIDLLVKI